MSWAAADPSGAERVRTLDGTLALFDLSGFTRLTERLGRHGRIGGELIGQLIDDVFSPVVGIVVDGGGDVLKFGGDAVLVFFGDDGHAARAVATGAAVLRYLRGAGSIATPSGPARVRMSGGLHSGSFTFVTVGRTHRELLVAGRHASTVVQMEAQARSGQLVVSSSAAAGLPAGWTGSGGGVVRLANVDRILGEGRRRIVPRGVRLGGLVPAGLAPRLGADSAEHRPITVAFVAVPGTDGLAEAALVARLDTVVEQIEDVCAGGELCWLKSDVGVDEVRFVLTAGLLQRSDDDEGRMLGAVRRIADRCRDVRIGVASGVVFVADAGHPSRRGRDIWGDVPNLAARLMAHALPGEVRVADDVLARSSRTFATTPLAPFAVKGRRNPVLASLLGGLRTIPEQDLDEGSPPFVGRAAELARLRAAVDELGSGRGAVMQLVGDAGAGKSRVLRELWSSRRDVRWVRCAGDPYEAAGPFGALRPALLELLFGASAATPSATQLRRAARTADRALEPWTPLVGAVLGVDVPPTASTRRLDPAYLGVRLRQVIVALLVAVVTEPVVVVAEDVHWFDTASLDLLDALAGHAPSRCWMVVTTSRPGGRRAAGAELVPVGPLADRDAAAIAVASGRLALDDATIARLTAQADGNPLFIRELARYVEGTTTVLPDSLERVIGASIDRLARDDRRLLRDLSVVAGSADLASMATVIDPHDLRTVLRRRAFEPFVRIDADGAVRFRHELFRAVAEAGLPFRRRRELHGRLADAIVADPGVDADAVAPTVAQHYHDADRPADVWPWALRAADGASRAGDWAEVATLLDLALTAAGRLDPQPDGLGAAAERLGDVAERIGRSTRATDAYRQARRLAAGDVIALARLLRKEGRVAERAGRYLASLRLLTRALRLLEPMGERRDVVAARVEARLAYSVTRFFQGHLERSIDLAELALRDATGIGDQRAVAQAHLQLEMACSELGRPERAVHGASALALFEELDDDLGLGNLLLNLGVSEYNESRWDLALDSYHRSSVAFERVGDVVGAASTLNNEAEILTDQGRLAEAAERLERAARMYAAAGYRMGEALTTSGRARVELRAGHHEVALASLHEARAKFGELGALNFVIDTDVRILEALVESHRAEEALRLAGDVRRAIDAYGGIAIIPITADRLAAAAHGQLGRRGEAGELVSRALARARHDAVPYEVLSCLAMQVALDGASASELAVAEIAELVARLGIVHLAVAPLDHRESATR